jgi:hypothetical protein
MFLYVVDTITYNNRNIYTIVAMTSLNGKF